MFTLTAILTVLLVIVAGDRIARAIGFLIGFVSTFALVLFVITLRVMARRAA